MRNYVRWMRAFSLIGAALLLVSAVLSWQKLPFLLSALFSVAGFMAEGTAIVLDLLRPRRLLRLSLEQNSENALLKAGEERMRHERVLCAFREAFSGFSSGARFWVLGITRILVYAALSAVCLFVSAGIAANETILLVFGAACLLSGGLGVYNVLLESGARAKFYRLALPEIDAIKREELHMTGERAAKEAESARAVSSIPAPVELFLKEETEKKDFRAVSKKGTAAGFLLGALYFCVLVVGMACGNALETLGAAVSWSIVLAVFAAVFAVSFVFILPISRIQREIYARNAAKFGDSETDRVRAELQRRWLRSQRAGNILFGCFTAGALALGVTLGLFGYFAGDGVPLSQALATGILPVLVYAALLSLAVWTIMYAVARHKMKPFENQLRELVRTEKS